MLKAVSEFDVIIIVLEIALFLKYSYEQCQRFVFIASDKNVTIGFQIRVC